MKRGNDLGCEPIGCLVLKLALPSMVAQLVNVLYSIIDRMYIGNIPQTGDIALAGVGVCGPIVTLLSSFGTLIGLGGSILMAMKLGEGKKDDARRILSNSFLLLVVFSAALTLLFLLFKRQLLLWFGASSSTLPYADTYLTIYTCGTFFALLAVGLNYFITCQGFPKIAMTTVLLGAIANIVLDFVFVIVLEKGVAGAAWATVAAQMLSCGFAVKFLFSSHAPVRIKFGGYSLHLVRRILSIGLSPFLILATDSVIIIVMNTVLQKYGGAAQGDALILCATIVQSYMMLITGPMIGITGGTQAILSYNYGAQKTARVKQAERTILGMCLAFTAVMFFVSRLIAPYFSRIFTQDASHIQLAVWGVETFTLAIVPLALQYTFVDGLTALGRTKTALFLSMFRKGTFVLCVLVLPIFFSAKSAFYAEPICDFVSACMATTVFLFIFNRHLQQREQGKPVY